MTDGPALLVVDEKDGGEHLAGRHLGLAPGLAVVVGIKDVATVANGYQALAGVGDIEQQAAHGLGRLNGEDRCVGGQRGCGYGRSGYCENGEHTEQRERFGQRRLEAERRLVEAFHGEAGRGAPHDGLTHTPFPFLL
ncbi:hypothetical protein D3C72_1830980 [compost metagenome]